MAGNAQERLLDSFLGVAGKRSAGRSIPAVFESARAEGLAGAISAFPGRAAGSGGSGLTKFLESGFGLGSLASELSGLFGGGGGAQAPTLTRYQAPKSLSFEAADTGSGLSSADYDQMGMARAYGAPGQVGTSGVPSPGGATPQITVNVQAMDSQSFMDRSTDIAAAVRHAMLNLNSINDVVSEL